MSFCRVFLVLFAVFLSGLISAEEVLLGVAEHSRFKRSHFIAALYTSDPEKKDAVYRGEYPAKMHMLITAKRISQQGFAESWVQGIAVNNDRETLAMNQREILRFSELFKGPLYAGDSIDIVTDTKQLVVSLNGVQLVAFESARLFPVLLSTWIGRVPHSTPFKEGILGQRINEKLLEQLSVADAGAERVAEVEAWVSGAALRPSVAVSTPPAAASVQVVKSLPPANKIVPIKVSATKKDIVVLDKPVIKPALIVKEAPVVQESLVTNAESVEVGEHAPIQSPEVVGAIAMDEQQSPPDPDIFIPLTEAELAKRLLVRQNYYTQLLAAVNVFKSVPQEAIMRRVSGEVRVLVEIDRQGALLNADLVGASKYDFFNKQALASVHKAVPFEAVPSELAGETFEFEVLIFYPPYF